MTENAVALKKNALESLSEALQVDKDVLKKTLKTTCFRVKDGQAKREPTDEEFMALVIVANTYKLNPVTREIYAFVKDGGVVPIVPIDGWVRIVNSQPLNDGVDLTENSNNGKFESVTARFFIKGRSNPVVVTEYLAECQKETEPWKKWPKRMLRHKAYIQGARIAYGLSGIFDPDEGQRILEVKDAVVVHEMPRRTTDVPLTIQAAEKANAEAVVEEVKIEQAPFPAGYKEIQAQVDVACKSKDCSMPIKKGEKVAFSAEKGIFHPDCVPVA